MPSLKNLMLAGLGLCFSIAWISTADCGGVTIHYQSLQFESAQPIYLVTIVTNDFVTRQVTAQVEKVISPGGHGPSSGYVTGKLYTFAYPPEPALDPQEWVQMPKYWDALELRNLLAKQQCFFILNAQSTDIDLALSNTPAHLRKIELFSEPQWQTAYAANTPEEEMRQDLADYDLSPTAYRGLQAHGALTSEMILEAAGKLAPFQRKDEFHLFYTYMAGMREVEQATFLHTAFAFLKGKKELELKKLIKDSFTLKPLSAERFSLLMEFFLLLDAHEPNERGLKAELLNAPVKDYLASLATPVVDEQLLGLFLKDAFSTLPFGSVGLEAGLVHYMGCLTADQRLRLVGQLIPLALRSSENADERSAEHNRKSVDPVVLRLVLKHTAGMPATTLCDFIREVEPWLNTDSAAGEEGLALLALALLEISQRVPECLPLTKPLATTLYSKVQGRGLGGYGFSGISQLQLRKLGDVKADVISILYDAANQGNAPELLRLIRLGYDTHGGDDLSVFLEYYLMLDPQNPSERVMREFLAAKFINRCLRDGKSALKTQDVLEKFLADFSKNTEDSFEVLREGLAHYLDILSAPAREHLLEVMIGLALQHSNASGELDPAILTLILKQHAGIAPGSLVEFIRTAEPRVRPYNQEGRQGIALLVKATLAASTRGPEYPAALKTVAASLYEKYQEGDEPGKHEEDRALRERLILGLRQLGHAEIHDFSPLHYASMRGESKEVKRLLGIGYDPNDEGARGYTPLMCASEEGRFEVVKMLLQSGADPNRTNPEGTRALDLAAANYHQDVVDYLKTYGKK